MRVTDKPLPLRHAARALRVPEDWLLAQAQAGLVPCLRLGRRLLFSLAAVEAALVKIAATARYDDEVMVTER